MKYPTLADLSPKDLRRLLSRYRITDKGCWEWTRSRTTTGYGHFSIDHTYYQAHRLMYSLTVAPVDDGLTLDRLCRNRGCVNPAHLEPVTHTENVRRGAATTLDADEVRLIREEHAAGKGIRAIARDRLIDHSTVSRIVNRRLWRDTEEAA